MTMTKAGILALVPEDKRGEVEIELNRLESLVLITSRDAAEQLARDNQFVRAVIDSSVSKEVAVHDSKFMAEKLPNIVDEEVKRRNPAKDPRDIALEQMQLKLTDMEKATIREKQRSRAIGKLAENGLPDKLAEFYLGDDDAATDAKLQILFEHIVPWKERAIETTLKERFGNLPMPNAGSPPAPVDLRTQFDKAVSEGNADLALALQSKLQTQLSKG